MSLMDTLLDETLENVETAPEFVDVPNGRYHLHIKSATPKEYEAKGDKPAGVRVTVVYSVQETLELADANQEPVDAGSLTSESFNLTAQGLPFFKRYLTNIFGETDGISLGDSIRALEGLDIEAVIKSRKVGDSLFTSTSNQKQL